MPDSATLARPLTVSLVIPGRNAASTVAACLTSVHGLLGSGRLLEILFVDDASTDDTRTIVSTFAGVRCLEGRGGGPGSARNVGWRAASGDLVWFIDSDCVARDGALDTLLPYLADPGVAGAGGSYTNLRPESPLACMIHEEILMRHRRMPRAVDFLGSFNVLYRREALEAVGGFDESRFNGPGSPGAEDAELAYRLRAAGFELRFDIDSRVGHHHPTNLRRYLRSQRRHGYWRVNLYLRHPDKSTGDAYSGTFDHMQPPLAMLTVLAAVLSPFVPPLGGAAVLAGGLLLAAQLPFAARLRDTSGKASPWGWVAVGSLRALWRGVGMSWGLVRALPSTVSGRSGTPGP